MGELKPEARDKMLQNLICWISTTEKLASLTNEELVLDCAKTEAADHLVVIEMMNRLYPGWENNES